MKQHRPYCNSLYGYSRFQTREVNIGSVRMGGNNPIRLQSMTTTDTMDTEGTIEQSIRMIDAGCELVRITAPSKKEAENLAAIKAGLKARGYETPLVADIHFTPNAAEVAAEYIEKVRVNPGNYADKKRFETIEYTDDSYTAELERIREKFTPLVLKCKALGRAMRIGTNHGSLSDRILSRYGDTPLGMVESAMEFIRICRDHDYHDLVISMKASNAQVMVQAYRLLVATMMEQGMSYPLHLGVTEAGDGEDGRIKSAVGIGTLLEDGLGDTIRVSLTEAPEAEIPVAAMLAERYTLRDAHATVPAEAPAVNPFEYHRRDTREVLTIGKPQVPRVVIDLSHRDTITPATLFAMGYNYSVPLDKWNMSDLACDFIFTGDSGLDFEIPGTLGVIQHADAWMESPNKVRHYPLFSAKVYLAAPELHAQLNFVEASIRDLTPTLIDMLKADKTAVLVLTTTHAHGMAEQRAAFFRLTHAKCDVPVIIQRSYSQLDEDRFMLYSSTDFGGLLLDGLGDGVWTVAPSIPLQIANRTAFGILQATRTRISKTEYISCPSCGRTLFDLQETTAKIRAATSHLKGVKIGIMGCIVNGPGEMADADYGYVGTGPGKISLYKEKEVVRKNVPEEQAVQALIDLIREHGDWVEVPAELT
ncbi:MAG: (E)-4-hydroxy-3-methylbut-2-enyl-diphosphate synthase [Flavobacteriales bacterium]